MGQTRLDNWTIHRKAVTESTNLDARDGKPGDVFVADEQTAGRGRLDHRWLSPPGENLTLSVVLDAGGIAPPEVATLPLVVGLAAATAASALLLRQTAIKWPNDVLLDGRKLAGILCERHGDHVIAGVGINVNQKAFAPEIALRATSLFLADGRERSLEMVLRAFLNVLGPFVADWRRDGFAALHPLIAPLDALRGRYVEVRQTDDDAAPVSGPCGGIQPDGTLLVGGTPVFAGEAHVTGIRKDPVRRRTASLPHAVAVEREEQ